MFLAERPAQAQNSDRQCKQVLDAMIHLPKQQFLPFFGPFRSEMSRAILDAPTTLPRRSLIGETVSEISTKLPFLRCRTVS